MSALPLSDVTGSWFGGYDAGLAYDECFKPAGEPRPHYRRVAERFAEFTSTALGRRYRLAELELRTFGSTFAVEGDPEGTERIIPFDLFPRVVPALEWQVVEAGLIQRVKALNAFIHDVYHDRCALRDGIVPEAIVQGNKSFRREVHGVDVPHGAYTNVAGIDLVRAADGRYHVLEDNLQVPSGVSYVLTSRRTMTNILPRLLAAHKVRMVEDYPDMLLETLRSLSPRDVNEPTVVVLTPGPYNGAYFEHVFLAQQMGVELVEPGDLMVVDNRVWMRTTRGRQQVDVIYRRVGDEYLDPACFNPESQLGVAGLVQVYRAGRVALANAIGTGVADSKALYAYVPKLIDYYLGEAALLPNVETYLGADPDHLDYLLEHAGELVIKRVDGAGGFGMLIGPHADEPEIAEYLAEVKKRPEGFIAQPVVQLSTSPTFAEDTGRFEPRHIDLRPFVLTGERIQVLPGGLTRVALRRGSLVVNSCQGGGSKDTWVLDE